VEKLKTLSITDVPEIMTLVQELNKKDSLEVQQSRLERMFSYPNYRCFGWQDGNELVAVSGTWTTERIYSGKQLEIDHFVVNPKLRSKGIGEGFLNEIEKWALENDCLKIELNAYVNNTGAQKFYLNKGYRILGFHFQKDLTKR
jgi:GNAT superfamily N-acetyltransferase